MFIKTQLGSTIGMEFTERRAFQRINLRPHSAVDDDVVVVVIGNIKGIDAPSHH